MVEPTGAAGRRNSYDDTPMVCDPITKQCYPVGERSFDSPILQRLERNAAKWNAENPMEITGMEGQTAGGQRSGTGAVSDGSNGNGGTERQPIKIQIHPSLRPRTMDGQLTVDPSLLQLDANRDLGELNLRRPFGTSFDRNDPRTWFKNSSGQQDFGMGEFGTVGLRARGLGTSEFFGQRDLLSQSLNPFDQRPDQRSNPFSMFNRNDPQLFGTFDLSGRSGDPFSRNGIFGDPLKLQIPGRDADPNWQRNPDALLELSKHYGEMTPEAQEYFKGLVDQLGMPLNPLRLDVVTDPKPEGGEQPAEVKPPAEQKPEGEAAQEGERPPEQVKPADQVVPEDRPPTPEEFDAAAAEKLSPLQQAIKDSGAYTVANFGDAYKDAALHDAGVAIVVVGSDIPGSEEAVKNIKAMQEKNPNLRFMVIDRDQVNAAVQADPNNAKMKEWQSWIDKSTGGRKEVLTSIQSLTADASGHPKPEKVTSYHWNNPNVAQEISDKAKLAADATVGHKGEFRLSLTAAEAQKLAGDIAAAHKAAFDAPMTDMASMKARHEKYVRAIQLASQARPDLMAERLKAIGQLPEDQRAAELAVYDQLLNEQSALRCELGLDMVKNAHRMPTAEQKQAMLSAGNDLLRDAFGRSQDLDSPENAGFVAAMRAANVNVDELKNSAATAPRVTSDQLLQKFEKAYGLQRPAQVENPRAEYRCDSRCVQQCRGCMPCGDQARGACYRRNGCGQGSCGPTQGGCGSQSGFGGGRVIRRVLGRCR